MSNPTDSEDTVFREIQSDFDVCSNCLRRSHVTYQRNYAVDTVKVDDFEWELWARKVDLPDESLPVDENRTSIPGDPVTRGLLGVCTCGYPSGTQHRPLPKSLFFRYAGNLVERFPEFGYEIDEERFFDVLEERKTDPSEQFADDRIYEVATSIAVISPESESQNLGIAD